MKTGTFPKHSKQGKKMLRCKVCWCEEKADGCMMINPCRCKGSLRWVHAECLRVWRASQGKNSASFKTCSVCGSNYRMHSQWLYYVLSSESFTSLVNFCLVVLYLLVCSLPVQFVQTKMPWLFHAVVSCVRDRDSIDPPGSFIPIDTLLACLYVASLLSYYLFHRPFHVPLIVFQLTSLLFVLMDQTGILSVVLCMYCAGVLIYTSNVMFEKTDVLIKQLLAHDMLLKEYREWSDVSLEVTNKEKD